MLLEHRYRVLEVIDIVTQDVVRVVLAFNVGDDNPKIRRAKRCHRRIGNRLIDGVPEAASGPVARQAGVGGILYAYPYRVYEAAGSCPESQRNWFSALLSTSSEGSGP